MTSVTGLFLKYIHCRQANVISLGKLWVSKTDKTSCVRHVCKHTGLDVAQKRHFTIPNPGIPACSLPQYRLQAVNFGGRIILRWVSERWDEIVWTGFFWSVWGPVECSCKQSNEPTGFMKYWEILENLSFSRRTQLHGVSELVNTFSIDYSS
jgi:hypothetical protein